MSFAVVAARNSGRSSTFTTTFAVPLPAGIVAGQLLLAFVGIGTDTTLSWPAGWNAIPNGAGNNPSSTIFGEVRYRIADGSEGATFTVTAAASEFAACSWRVENHRAATSPPEAATATGGSTTLDPPSLSPSWGAEDTLWLALGVIDGADAVTAFPASYGDTFSLRTDPASTNVSDCTIVAAERALNTGTENPGAYTNGNKFWRSFTVAIRSNPDVVSGSANLPVPVAAGSVYAAELVSGAANLPLPVASGFVYEPIVRPFRVLQHLLPRALAWRTTVNTALRRYLLGLGRFADEVRTFIDLVYLDLFPETTRELDSWAAQFALAPGDEASRRLALAGAWLARGGQSPDYLQSVIHAAGFTTVFVHEWWASGPPYVALDPRNYTKQLLLGEYQCEGTDPWECFDPGPGDPLAPHCDDSLANDPGYLVNLDLTRRAPPPVPNDPSFWPYFLYFAGEVFPELAPVDATRFDELKELLLRICPTQQWIVLLIDPIDPIELAGEGFGSGPMGTVELGV